MCVHFFAFSQEKDTFVYKKCSFFSIANLYYRIQLLKILDKRSKHNEFEAVTAPLLIHFSVRNLSKTTF